MIVAAIPAFNVEKSIAKVILLAKKSVDMVIVCDDGSKDMTGDISRSLGAKVIAHERNMGYGAALSTLFKEARRAGGDVMVTIDGDGQHDPREIGKLTGPVLSGEADVVIGSRFLKGGQSGMPGYRRVGVATINKVSGQMAYAGITDSQSGYRAYDRKAIELLSPSEMGMGASTEILSRAGEAHLKILEVPVEISYDEGSSTHNPVYHGLDVLLSTVKQLSIKHPLIFYGVPGFASLLVALGFWWWTLSLFEQTHALVTNLALIAVASTVVGLVFMAVAVMLWVLISVVREGRE
ncbi:MAG: glycosyltransferase family 2 protein [Nitrososphaerales archaeon]